MGSHSKNASHGSSGTRQSKSSRRSNSKETERKSQSHEKELLVTPPPELSERSFRILPREYQPPQGYHLPQGYQPTNPAPIIIMAPENLTSGMFNMMPGMGNFQNNY